MKAVVYIKNDWDYEVIDVWLGIYNHDGTPVDEHSVMGFDESDWQQANQFAETLAKTLNIEFVGDRTDT